MSPYNAGERASFPPDEARRLVGMGAVVIVKEPGAPVTETASVPVTAPVAEEAAPVAVAPEAIKHDKGKRNR
jgi:hypothetical protein